MHEYSLVQAMFDQMGAIVTAQNARSIRRVRVRIGRLAGVDPSLFHTAYDMFRTKTFCDQAPLEIEQDASDALILEQIELEVA
jgi:Zn finger protein HypA/HybF (possibly regulating hydrogenase expression)